MVLAEFAVIVTMMIVGAQRGGVFFGMSGGVALLILMSVFHLAPASPALDVMLIIVTVVLSAGTMQAAGGMDLLIAKAEKMLRKHPNQIVYIAPLVGWIFTFLSGTGNVLYNVLPVIAEVSKNAGVRPERPISVAVIASQHAVPASPISAASVAMATLLAPFGISMLQIMSLIIPASLIGVMVSAFIMRKRGKELNEDPEYLYRVKNGMIKEHTSGERHQLANSKEAKISVAVFLIASLTVVFLGTFAWLRPEVINAAGKVSRVNMTQMIQLIMLTSGALMILLCKVEVKKVVEGSVFRAGMIGVVNVFGLTWMSNTFITQNMAVIESFGASVVASNPSLFAIALFAISIITHSQGATVAAIIPLGISLGVDPLYLAAIFPAVCGYFVIPSTGVVLAGVAFDSTGTTKIGKFLINHSYILPGIVATFVATLVGIGIRYLLY